MIRVENVHKLYPTRLGANHVLRGIDFTLARGEKLGIMGRNGAGKSTLLRLVSGAERPSRGRIEREMSVSWPLAFGGAFQPSLTGRDNVRFISAIYQQDFERNLAFVEEFAELGAYLREPVRNYSSGMRARLAFAISMIIEFDCFLIDEVGAVGDARFHQRCNEELFERRGDRAMIIISHDASYVRDHCNRFAVLDGGRLELFDDFDAAHARFAKSIGLGTAGAASTPTTPRSFRRRTLALDSLRRIALADERFRLLVQRGDWARDRPAPAEAFQEYGAALALHPYERSYWAQLGHAAMALGQPARAEISYRTACALGEPVGAVIDFLASAVAAQHQPAESWPARSPDPGTLSSQPPAFPDLALLAGLLWAEPQLGDDTALALLRECPALDLLAARMLSDPRATRWLAEGHGQLPGQVAMVPGCAPDHAAWQAGVLRLIAPDHAEQAGRTLPPLPAHGPALASALVERGAFADWPAAAPALAALAAPRGGRPSAEGETTNG